ncbi:unnamed protein product [Allacma fusca]|uniref:PDEase domain-containing protein n=1 Tax=Allacma fusca TaxID=39272 RepID=A0A8J2J9K0_9HEXA|nr:unnamed protein product [Allacma fusca]
MTAADLCASAKPWEVQAETVRVIFEEFYEQGDLEKKQGRTPIPMMDRDKAHQLPSSQVGFLSVICISCYDLLSQVVPPSEPLLEGCRKNLIKWKHVAENQSEIKSVETDVEEKPE